MIRKHNYQMFCMNVLKLDENNSCQYIFQVYVMLKAQSGLLNFKPQLAFQEFTHNVKLQHLYQNGK